MEFQGFQNSIPAYLVIVLVFSLIGVAFLSYQKRKSIPAYSRIGLITLRSVSLLIVLLLFLNPYFFSSSIEEKKPRLLLLFDNSESVSLSKGDYEGSKSYLEIIEKLNLKNNSGIDFEYFTIGNSSAQINNLDSLSLLESETNFALALSQLQELEENFDGSIIFSDGIITFGRNPIIQASNLSIPLYTIALGDTTKLKDVILSNVVTNPLGLTNTTQTIMVEVSQNSYLNTPLTLELLNSDKEVLDLKEIIFSENEEIISTSFEVNLKESGLQQFTVRVEEKPEEWTIENNYKTFSIDVTDSKIRVLHLAFEIHPDVKLVRSILSEDINVELNTLTWLGNSRFIETEIPVVEEMDLVIIHGSPNSEFISPVTQSFATIPTVFFQLPKNRVEKPSGFNGISFLKSDGTQLFNLDVSPTSEGANHPIMELSEVNYQSLAPLVSSLRSTSVDPSSESLINSRFQGIDTPNSVLSVIERDGIRRVNIAAWNWFKMYQSPNNSERAFVTELFTNIVTWASNDPDERRLKISTSKPVFGISDEVILNGALNNESGESENSATIELTLSKENEESKAYNMTNLGNGSYQLKTKSLGSGLYSFEATARKNGREIDTQSGEFLIEDSNSELINTIRNDELLRSLSIESGGAFFEFNNLETFWETLNTDGVLSQKEELVETYTFPVRSWVWFAILLVLLISEWLFRKRYSLP